MDYNTIIIGSGISGMTAAIYLKRAGIDVCIFEKSSPGGQLLRTSIVENYPGIEKAEGSTIAMNLYNQITALKVPVDFEEIIKIESHKKNKTIYTQTKKVTCKNIIIATGRIQKKLELENEEKFIGRGISYCAICDGALYKGKEVAVIGAGNSAFEEALYLSNLCSKVTIISRRNEFRADTSLIQEIKKQKNIKILTNQIVTKIVGNEKIEALQLEEKETQRQTSIKVDGCFVFIGQIPDTKFLQEMKIELQDGYIKTDENMQTNIKGIYACGDCRRKNLYQLVTATYDGAVAADKIIKTIEKEG